MAPQATSGVSEAPPAGPRPAALAMLGLTALVALGLDIATKQLALTWLGDGSVVRLLGGAVYLDLTRNSGAAFSIGAQFTAVFPVVTLVVLAGIAWLVRRLRSLPWALAMGLVVGGAVGNLTDRLFRAPGPWQGHVVDFISVFAPGGQTFPIFNMADSALFCGVVLAVLLELTGRRRDGTRLGPSAAGQVPDPRHEDA